MHIQTQTASKPAMPEKFRNHTQRVQQVLEEMGYPAAEAEVLADEFVTEKRHELQQRNRPDTEVKVNSFDRNAGEIIITVHDTSDRAPDEVLNDFLESHNKDPDTWAVKEKLKNTGLGDSYVAKPVRTRNSSSSGSGGGSSESLSEKAEDMDPDEAEELLEKLLDQSDG